MDNKETPARNDAFRCELVKHLSALRGWGKTLTRNTDAADDLVQQTFLEALKSEGTFMEGAPMQKWLFTIMRRLWSKSLDERVKDSRSVHIEDEATEFDRNLTVQPAQEDVLHAQEAHKAMDSLSDEHREALFFVSIHGYSYEEAAEVCGVEVGTIRSRVSRARRELLKAYEEGLGSIVQTEHAPVEDVEGPQKEKKGRGRPARQAPAPALEAAGDSERPLVPLC